MTRKDLKTVISLLGLFKDFNTWTIDKKNIIKLVYKYLESGTHEHFNSDCRLHPEYVGDYCIFPKSHKRRGTLKKYRGKRIIVICAGHGNYNARHYLVATIEQNKTVSQGIQKVPCIKANLIEDISEPGGFALRNIRRNTANVYQIDFS